MGFLDYIKQKAAELVSPQKYAENKKAQQKMIKDFFSPKAYAEKQKKKEEASRVYTKPGTFRATIGEGLPSAPAPMISPAQKATEVVKKAIKSEEETQIAAEKQKGLTPFFIPETYEETRQKLAGATSFREKVGILALAGLSLQPLAPSGKIATATTKIAKLSKVDDIVKVIKNLYTGKSDDVIRVVAEKLAPITDEKVVSEILNDFTKVKPAQEISKELAPLAAEAKKYKSAEEFVKARTPEKEYVTVYHRTNTPLKEFGKKPIYSKENRGEFFVSNRPNEQIVGYGDNVLELRIKKKDLEINDEFPSGEEHYTIPTKVADEAIKTKSQLEQIWEEANKEVKISQADIIKPTAEATTIKPTEDAAVRYVQDMVAKQKAAGESGIVGLLTKGKSFLREVKAKLVDFNAPIEDVIRTAQKAGKYEVLPKYDITHQIDRVLRAPTIAGQFARDNGLEAVIKGVDNLENLDQYLIAKQASKVAENGIKTGRDLEKDKMLIEAFSEKYEPYAAQVRAYSQKLLDYSVESGLVSKDLAARLKAIYPDYVPLNRVFNELEKTDGAFGSRAVASLSKQNIVQRLVGSEREIESPIKSLLSKTNDAFRQGEKNKAAKILARFKDLPGSPFNLRELKAGEHAAHTISFLDNGVKRTFETTKEIAEAAKALNVQQLNILGKIFALPVRVAKLGITGINLPFVVANIVKDQLFATIMSSKALKTSAFANPINFVKSLFSAIKHDEVYRELVRQGAGGTSFDIARSQLPQTIEKIRSGKSVLGKIKYTARHPGELLRAIENIVGRSEELTRIQQFRGTKEAFLKTGRTAEDATILASRAARENTVNFARRGEWGSVLNSAFLYLNANIQGSRLLVRGLKEKPLQTGAKMAIVLFFPMATITAWNMADNKRKEVYADIADYEKENNFIIIPPNPTKDAEGKWNVIKIPLPAGIGKLASIPRLAMEQASGLDKIGFSEVAKSIIGSISPVDIGIKKTNIGTSLASTFTPQAIKPTLEAITNKSFFTGYNIVPQSMEKISPELQYKDYTSGTVRKVGEVLNLSPLKIENFVRGTFGGVGSQILNASDRVLAGLDIIPEDQIGGQDVIKAITARFIGARGGESEKKSEETIQKILQNQADERFKLKQEAELLYDDLKSLPKEQANEKAKKIKKANPALYEKLKDIVSDAKLGLTYEDRLIKQLGVENGERAKFIWETTNKFVTKEEKNAYIKELRQKKIISDEVMKQLKELAGK